MKSYRCLRAMTAAAPLTVADVIQYLDDYINEEFWMHNNTDVKIVSNALTYLNELLEKTDGRVCVSDVLNAKPYEWYFGNFISKLLVMLVNPFVLISDGTAQVEQLYTHCLSAIQVNDLIWNMYRLVISGQCAHNVEDYYGFTPLQSLTHFVNEEIPLHIRECFSEIRCILKHGEGIVKKQQGFVKRWIDIKRAQKKAAVERIEGWWLEILLNPDSNVGHRKVGALSSHFYGLAK